MLNDIEARFQRSVQIDKVQLLYRQSSHAVLGALIAGVFWAAIVWQHPTTVNHVGLSLWLLTLAALSGVRLLMFIAYRRVNPQGDAVLRWFTPYVATLVLSSAVWGIGTVLVVISGDNLLLVITYVFAIGLTGAALSNYGVYVWLVTLVVALILTPSLLALLFRGDFVNVLLALSGAWFVAMATRGLAVHNRAVDESFRLSHELRRANEIAEHRAQIDGLTGLKNRSAFLDTANAIISVMSRGKRPVCMLAIDIDQFKQVNDTFGHAAGDATLIAVAEVFQTVLRRSDVCGRLGGDEFAVLLPEVDVADGLAIAEKLRAVVERETIEFNQTQFTVTLSIGVAVAEGDAEALLALADHAMYEAKALGKNRVVRQFASAVAELGLSPSSRQTVLGFDQPQQ